MQLRGYALCEHSRGPTKALVRRPAAPSPCKPHAHNSHPHTRPFALIAHLEVDHDRVRVSVDDLAVRLVAIGARVAGLQEKGMDRGDGLSGR